MESGKDAVTRGFFTPVEVWSGGYYELHLDLNPPTATQLNAVLQALWSHPSLDGCYLSNRAEPSEQERVPPDASGVEDRLYGIARLPNGTRVACGTYAFASLDEVEHRQPQSLVLFIPMCALSHAYPVGAYPFGPMEGVLHWKSELDQWLAGIARFIYQRAPFALGLIGFEVNTAETISAESLEAHGIPDKHLDGILWPRGNSVE